MQGVMEAKVCDSGILSVTRGKEHWKGFSRVSISTSTARFSFHHLVLSAPFSCPVRHVILALFFCSVVPPIAPTSASPRAA